MLNIDNVLAAVRATNQANNHHPSEEVYAALADIPVTVAHILEGTAKPAMHICALDVGAGKTVTLRHTARALREECPDTGLVLCLGRLQQIETMIGELGLGADDYAVLVGKGAKTSEGTPFAEMGLGQDRINAAPILLTTHAQLAIRLQATTWADAGAFWYRGKPRPVRIWDEACAMRRDFSLGEPDLYRVLAAVPPKPLADLCKLILRTLEDAEDRDLFDVPELDIDIDAILSDMPDRDYKVAGQAIRDLAALAGKQALVARDRKDNVLLQYEQQLPADLLPLIVLDASARDRQVYAQQGEPVVWLKSAEKRYDRVTINVKNGPSGKRAFWNNYQERLREAAEIILAHPDREPLIIHPKESQRWQIGKIEEELKKHLGEDRFKRVHFLHWGAHDAVNDHRQCDLVIALTLYHFPRYDYEIMGRAAADRPLDHEYGPDKIRAVERGEILSHIRQGFGRSCIRKWDGNQANECVIYVQTPTKSGTKKELKPLFPGVQVANEAGKLDQEEKVLSFLKQNARPAITYPEVYKPLGILQPNFSPLMKRPSMREALAAEGWQVKRSKPNKIIRIRG